MTFFRTYGNEPHIVDPLDERYLYVRESNVEHEIADEG